MPSFPGTTARIPPLTPLLAGTLSMGAERGRALAALLALATVPVGLEVSAAAQLVVIVGLLVVMLVEAERGRIRF